MKHPRIRGRTALLSLAVATAAGLGSTASATAATWVGAGSSDAWSTGSNWSAGAAPSGSVSQLTLPPSGSSCAGWQCSFAVDDISGLTVGTLGIDASANYLIVPSTDSNSIQLMDGLTFSTSDAPAGDRLLTTMAVPLTLGAKQTWSLTGVSGTPTELALGAVTGTRYPLTLQLKDGVALTAPELDTGLLTLRGGGSVTLAAESTEPADDMPVSPPPLISPPGVRLEDGAALAISSPDTVSGPITVAPGSYSMLEIGHGVAPDASVFVDGDVTLRANSTLGLWIDQPAAHGKPQASSDYSQLTVDGEVSLNGTGLALGQGSPDGQPDCATLTGGQLYTLISAVKVAGSFSGIANGQVVPLGACDPTANGPSYAAIISYETHGLRQTVTARIVGATQIRELLADALAIPAQLASVRSVLRHHGYTARLNAPDTGALQVTWTAIVRRERTTLARASATLGQVGPRSLPIELTAAGRKLLRRSKKTLTLTATLAFTPDANSPYQLKAITIKRRIRLS